MPDSRDRASEPVLSRDWLTHQITLAEAFPDHADDAVRYRHNLGWEWLRTQMRPNDEVWEIRSPEPFPGWYEGIAIVRDGEIVAHSLLESLPINVEWGTNDGSK